jgi:methyltransferase-like protein 6
MRGAATTMPPPPHARAPPTRRPPHPLRAYPGDPAIPPAGEYHDADFAWEEHAVGAAAALRARLGGDGAAYAASAWNAFHARDNGTARFYQERRYLPLAFPDALAARRIVELGAGAGASLLPLLRAAPAATALATDVSPPALDLCARVAAAAGVGDRVATALLDAAAPDAPATVAGERADACVLVFTLGALDPARHAPALATAAACLRPGGRLLFRDHGVFDLTHLRAPRLLARLADDVAAPALHARSDGTLAFFFTPDYVASLAAGAGLATVECRWATVARPNRRTGVVLRRVMVHGVFENPGHGSGLRVSSPQRLGGMSEN